MGEDSLDVNCGVRLTITVHDDRVDHRLQAHPLAVLRGEDPDSSLGKKADLLRRYDPPTTTVDLDLWCSRRGQPIDQVGEVLDVAALVGGDGHRIGVLLNRGLHNIVHRAVVTEMDHLGALRLQDASHDVDRRVVAVEEARGRNHAHRMLRHVQPRPHLGRLPRNPTAANPTARNPVGSTRSYPEDTESTARPTCQATVQRMNSGLWRNGHLVHCPRRGQ